jgi:hypothetical protein
MYQSHPMSEIEDIEDIAERFQENGSKPKLKLTIKQPQQVQLQLHIKPQPTPQPKPQPKPQELNGGTVPPPKLVKYQVLSASRRTDIPRFYMPLILEAMNHGYIEVTSPAPYCVKSCVSLSPNDVKCIAWWSKDYSIWLQTYHQNRALFDRYAHLFNFTLTGDPQLEPHISSTLEQRLTQLTELCQLFGSRSIQLRFDPITFWFDDKQPNVLHDNIVAFERIIAFAHDLGIKHVIFAFCLPYPKVVRRFQKRHLTLKNLTLLEQQRILDGLINCAQKYAIQMETCCSSQLVGYREIKASKCLDRSTIEELCGSHLKRSSKDTGQREACNCVTSRDIGSYQMSCGHGCIYCYANPAT